MEDTRIIYEIRSSTILYNFLKGIEESKIFLIPSNVCPIVPLIFLKAGRKFDLVDISPGTLCMDEGTAIKKIRGNPLSYGGILFVRTYGFEESCEPFFNQIKSLKEDLIIIDDRCLSVPFFEHDEDMIADLTLFSTGHAKYADLSFCGFAFLNTHSSEKYKNNYLPYQPKSLEKLTLMYKNAISNNQRFDYEDTDWLSFAEPEVLFSDYKKMVESKISEVTIHKTMLNKIYSENLPREIQLNAEYQNWRFNILVPEKNILLGKIFRAGLFASSHYASADAMFFGGKSENTEILYKYVVNLFNDHCFSIEMALELTAIIASHLQRYGIIPVEKIL